MNQLSCMNGRQIAPLGLGTWKLTPAQATEVVSKAIDMGYRHIDCAWIYENESGVGEGIRSALSDGAVKREDLWITSKLWNHRHIAGDVASAIRESLDALGLEQLDLYLMHWPIAHRPDVARPSKASEYLSLVDAPLEKTWEAMHACVESGLCRYIGVSNFNESKIRALVEKTGIRPAMNQVESHPFLQQRSLFEFCRSEGIGFTAYSPLGSGDRPDAMKRSGEPGLLSNPVIQSVAAEIGCRPGQVLLAWALARGTVAIPKATSEQHLRDNLAAPSIQLNEDQIDLINGLEQGYRFVDGTFWELPEGPYTVEWLWNG